MADAGEVIAEKVVAFINDPIRNYSMKFSASTPEDPDRVLSPSGEDAPKTVEVFAVPVTELREKIDRCAIKRTHSINVFVSRLRQAGVTRKTLLGLVNEIVESLDFEDMGDYTWVDTEVITKYDAEKLRTENRFLSVFKLNYYDVT